MAHTSRVFRFWDVMGISGRWHRVYRKEELIRGFQAARITLTLGYIQATGMRIFRNPPAGPLTNSKKQDSVSADVFKRRILYRASFFDAETVEIVNNGILSNCRRISIISSIAFL